MPQPYHHILFAGLISCSALGLVACDQQEKPQPTAKNQTAQQSESATPVHEAAEVLPFLNIKTQPATFAIPFCEKKNCLELDIQTVHTQDAWLNQWIAKSQSSVIQDQMATEPKAMSLQQAVNAYVKQSDAWQAEFKTNKPYELHLDTRIASQRNQYVLLQMIVNSQQQDVTVKDRGYFYVADRKLQKKLALLDVIDSSQQNPLNQLIQDEYAAWSKTQTAEVKKHLPKKLYWGQSDWFFDNEGIGLHYRANEIAEDATQLDIYFSQKQTKSMLKADIFPNMF